MNGTITQSVTIADGDLLSFTDGADTDKPFSLAIWCNEENWATYISSAIGLFYKGSATDIANREYLMQVAVDGTNYVVYFTLFDVSSGGVVGRKSGDIRATNGKDVLIVGTYDGSETSGGIDIYLASGGAVTEIDTADVSVAGYAGMENTATGLKIAKRRDADSAINGKVLTAIIFPAKLTLADISSYYDSYGLYRGTNNPVAIYNGALGVSEGQSLTNGTVIPDLSGHALNGVASNGVTEASVSVPTNALGQPLPLPLPLDYKLRR